MSIWSKIGRIFAKVGETTIETAEVVVQVNLMETHVKNIGRSGSVTPNDINILLERLNTIRNGVDQIRK